MRNNKKKNFTLEEVTVTGPLGERSIALEWPFAAKDLESDIVRPQEEIEQQHLQEMTT